MIMDPRLRNQYSLPAARRIAKLADSCLNKNARERPLIGQIVEVLKQAIADSEEEEGSSSSSSLSAGRHPLPQQHSRSNLLVSSLNRRASKMETTTSTRQRSHAAKVNTKKKNKKLLNLPLCMKFYNGLIG